MPKMRISNLYDRAIEVLGDQERAEAWLKAPNKALGMKTPLQYADTEPRCPRGRKPPWPP